MLVWVGEIAVGCGREAQIFKHPEVQFGYMKAQAINEQQAREQIADKLKATEGEAQELLNESKTEFLNYLANIQKSASVDTFLQRYGSLYYTLCCLQIVYAEVSKRIAKLFPFQVTDKWRARLERITDLVAKVDTELDTALDHNKVSYAFRLAAARRICQDRLRQEEQGARDSC